MLIARSDTRLSGTSGERTWSWRELGTFGNDLSSFPCSSAAVVCFQRRGVCAAPALQELFQRCPDLSSCAAPPCSWRSVAFTHREAPPVALQVLSCSKRAGTALPFAFPSTASVQGSVWNTQELACPFLRVIDTHFDQNLTLFLLQDLNTLSRLWDALLFGFPWRNKAGLQSPG